MTSTGNESDSLAGPRLDYSSAAHDYWSVLETRSAIPPTLDSLSTSGDSLPLIVEIR